MDTAQESFGRAVAADLDRYCSLLYLRGKPGWRRSLAALAHPGLRTVIYFRLGRQMAGWPAFARLLGKGLLLLARWLLWPSRSCEIPFGTTIGPGLFLPHPIGIVVAPQSVLGSGVSLFSGVVLGINHLSGSRQGPTLGDEVVVYAGAKVVGEVSVGRGVIIGANAVVVSDAPDQAIVAGVPARQIGIRPAGQTIEF
jgi:serine O-acetyltransferase